MYLIFSVFSQLCLAITQPLSLVLQFLSCKHPSVHWFRPLPDNTDRHLLNSTAVPKHQVRYCRIATKRLTKQKFKELLQFGVFFQVPQMFPVSFYSIIQCPCLYIPTVNRIPLLLSSFIFKCYF